MSKSNDKDYFHQAICENDPELSETDARILAEDPGPIREFLFSQFRGKMFASSLIVSIYLILFTAAAVFCGIRFFSAETVKDWIMYSVGFAGSVGIVSLVKLWHWMLTNRNAITREVKRLELHVARLTEIIESQDR